MTTFFDPQMKKTCLKQPLQNFTQNVTLYRHQSRFWNLVEDLWWGFFVKKVISKKSLTIFAKKLHYRLLAGF